MPPPPSAHTLACFELEDGQEGFLRQQLGELALRSTPSPLGPDTVHLAQGAALVSVFIRSHVNAALLADLPELRFVATRSTGCDHVDLAACRDRGIVVSNVPTYGENTVAEQTFGLILALARKIHQAYDRTVRGDFSLDGLRGFDLKGRTLGVIGTGNIGLHVIRIGRGFGMTVLANDVREQSLLADLLDFRYVSLEELLRQSDIVTLHVPYLPGTHHLINRERLGQMKPGSLLINTARGGVVDTSALLWALDTGLLAGAGLDVLESEELLSEERRLLSDDLAAEQLRTAERSQALLRRDNVIFTPHVAFNSADALQRILETTVANVRAFLAGHPINLVGTSSPSG